MRNRQSAEGNVVLRWAGLYKKWIGRKAASGTSGMSTPLTGPPAAPLCRVPVGKAATRAFVVSFVVILALNFFLALLLNQVYEYLWPQSKSLM